MPSDTAAAPSSDFDLTNSRSNAAQSLAPIRILSLTGGGYRGLFTAQTLVSLCDAARRQEPLDKTFNVFAGTSIGGLLACALAVGVRPRRVLDAIDAHGPAVFKKKHAPSVRRMFFGNLYESDHLKEAIRACLGSHADTPICDIQAGLLVPAVNWVNGEVQFFMSGYFGKARASDATLLDVCLATSAAPTYFKPA